MIKLKTYRSQAKGLADLLPYAALIEPDILLCKDGTLLAAWEIRGVDTESSTAAELSAVSARMNQVLRQLGAGWMLHVDALRLPATEYPRPEQKSFPDAISRLIDQERREYYTSSGQFYTTTTVLTICYKASRTDARLKKMASKTEESFLEQSLATFKKTLVLFDDGLVVSVKQRERLGSSTMEGVVYSPLLSFLQLCLTGEEYLPCVPHTPVYLDALLGGQDLIGGMVPRIGHKHIAMIALEGLPSESWPSMLSFLASLPFPSRFSTRFICMDQFDAIKEVDKYRKTWAQSIYRFFDKIFNKVNPRPDRDALAMAQDAEDAYASLQGGYMGAGFYTANVVLLDENPEALQEKIRIVRRALMQLGFGCRLEEINALEAWLSTHPGNSFANVRRPMISTLNLADLLPLSSVWTGEEYNPCPFYPPKSPALFQCATDNSTPFWLNLHYGDLGHTLVVGPTGAGKSTLLASLALAHLEYPSAQIFAFDKGMSMFAACSGAMGCHYTVGGSGSPSFSPLTELTTVTDQAWAEEWIASCVALSGTPVLPGHRSAIHEAVLALSKLTPSLRTMTNFQQHVSNHDVKIAIAHYTMSGAMGHLLDASADGLTSSYFTVFEIEELMTMGERNLLPVLLYLFRHIERSLNGQPTLLILDEAWLMLGNSVFKEKIREWLKVLRKANCAVILSTQSLSDLMKSGIMDVLIESCPTKILLANDKAKDVSATPFYQAIGLNERQLEQLAEATPKREYYVINPAGQRMVNLALQPKALAFVGASSKEDIARIKELQTIYGQNWTEHWLKERAA